MADTDMGMGIGMGSNQTDFHCHLLPALDDGARSVEESLEMARLLVAAGFREICCTPHCLKGMYETTPEQVRAGVARLQSEVERRRIPLKLHPGMEYCLDEFFAAELDRLLPLGDTRLVLVEAPLQADPLLVKECVFLLRRRQYVPLIAHPERSPLFRTGPEPTAIQRVLVRLGTQGSKPKTRDSLLGELRTMGALFQGNLGSFSGFYGAGVRRQAEALRQAGFYHCYGTDAHRAEQVAEGIARGIGDMPIADFR